MSRIVLGAIGIAWLATGAYILAAPQAFYAQTPGLSAMGPFSAHFITDVALALTASGAIAAWAAYKASATLAIAATVWPSLHALFHLQIWAHRGLPLDAAFVFDGLAVVAPAALAGWAALTLRKMAPLR